MTLTTIVAGFLVFALVVTLAVSYLMYVRMRELQEEVQAMRSKVEVHDDELANIESSLKSVDLSQ